MRELSSTENALFRAGALLMLGGAASYLFTPAVGNGLYVVGVLLFGLMQLRTTYEGDDFVIARLRRQQLFGATMFALSAAAMTYQTLGHNVVRYNEWVVCLLIGAVVELYATFRLASELEKKDK